MKKKFLIEDLKLMKKMNLLLYKKYGNSKKNYYKQKISNLINGKNTHFFINFQENALYDDLGEYHKRFYHKWENKSKLKEFYDYYLNYLIFFCRPIFRNLYYNSLLHYCSDVKADIFYKNNYKEEKNYLKENKFSTEKNNNFIKDKVEKINFLIFDKETRNRIDNSSNIISSIDRVNEEDQNMSYTQKLKINDNNYITLRNNKENLIDFINEIKFSNNNINKKKLKKEKENEKSLINHFSSLNQKISKNYLSHDINLLDNYLKKNRKFESNQDKIKYMKLIKNNKTNKSGDLKNQNNSNITKEKVQENNTNTIKFKKFKKLDINFKNYKSNIYNLFKNNFVNYKSNKTKNNNSIKIKEIQRNRYSNINIDEKRFSVNNNMKKYKPKIIDYKKNSFINTTEYFKNNLSVNNNKSMKMKTINNNIVGNPNTSSINKKQVIFIHKNTNKYSKTKIEKKKQNGRNSKKNYISSIYSYSKPINSNNNNLLQTYLKNCPNFKRLTKSKSLLKEKTKNICHSIDQMKTFSVRLLKSYNKKNKYHEKLLRFINNFRNNYNGSNNISINDKTRKKNNQIISKKIMINKNNSNSIIKGNKEVIYPKKNNIINKNEVKFNVNLNLHSIFININPSSNYQQNNNENKNNTNKKILLNSFLYDNPNINGKSIKIKKNKKIINNDYKNKTQSYKSRNKTRNKIKKTNNDKNKGTNSFIYINTNLNNKHLKGGKEKFLKRNNTIFKLNKNNISGFTFNKIALYMNKKIYQKKKNENII